MSSFHRALAEQLSSADVFRITITSFLDAYNFDVRRLMKCCIHHVLPSGHIIPFCAYNVLYRDGHVQLPAAAFDGTQQSINYAFALYPHRPMTLPVPLAYPIIIGPWQSFAVPHLRVSRSSACHCRPARNSASVWAAFIGAMLGAKLPFVISDWTGLLSGAAWFSDGKTILLGLVGGYFGVIVAKWSLDIHTHTGDSFAVPVAAAVAIGRLGLLRRRLLLWHADFASLGRRVSASRSVNHGIQRRFTNSCFTPRWPSFCLCSGDGDIFPGQLIKLYILSYVAYRFLTEFIRPEAQLWLGLTGYQWACLRWPSYSRGSGGATRLSSASHR